MGNVPHRNSLNPKPLNPTYRRKFGAFYVPGLSVTNVFGLCQMNVIRVNRWEIEMSERVNELGSNQRSNLVWLINHLAEYVQRWIGFSCMKEIGVSGTLDTDAFCILLGTSLVVDEQLRRGADTQWFPGKEWENFKKSLDYIQEYPMENNLSIVSESFDRLCEALK